MLGDEELADKIDSAVLTLNDLLDQAADKLLEVDAEVDILEVTYASDQREVKRTIIKVNIYKRLL